jgi:hypothetical protein
MFSRLVATFCKVKARRSIASLIVWAMLWSIASPVTVVHASVTDLPIVFCASDPTAIPFDVDAPHKAPSSEHSALEHCALCFSGTGSALPSANRGLDLGSPTPNPLISLKFDTAAAEVPKAGTLGSRAPPRSV